MASYLIYIGMPHLGQEFYSRWWVWVIMWEFHHSLQNKKVWSNFKKGLKFVQYLTGKSYAILKLIGEIFDKDEMWVKA